MGYVYLYIGTGAGKTTNSLGLALRSLGHNHKVVIIQFMKSRTDIGEVKIAEKLGPNYEIHPVGREGWIDFKNPKAEDFDGIKKGMELAGRTLRQKPNLLILDELALAAYFRLLPVREVLDLLNNLPTETNVIITGRYAPHELIERAEFVNEIKEIRYPKEMLNIEGINY